MTLFYILLYPSAAESHTLSNTHTVAHIRRNPRILFSIPLKAGLASCFTVTPWPYLSLITRRFGRRVKRGHTYIELRLRNVSEHPWTNIPDKKLHFDSILDLLQMKFHIVNHAAFYIYMTQQNLSGMCCQLCIGWYYIDLSPLNVILFSLVYLQRISINKCHKTFSAERTSKLQDVRLQLII